MAVTTAELKAIITLQDQMSAQLKTVKGELASLQNSVKSANSAASSGGQSWLSMASAMAAGSLAARALSGALTSVTQQAMSMGKATADFGQSMANINAMSTTADMAQYGAEIEKLAMRLGKDYPLSAAEAGNAIEALVKKGTSLKDIVGGAAEAVVKLSAATGGDLVVSAEVVNAALDTFKMTAGQTSEATKLMTGAMLSSGMSLNDYKYGLSAAGAVVQSYGGTLADLTIGLAAMTKAGIEGADAGTSIKSMYNGLIPTTKTATSLMKELGIITKDGSNQFVDATGKMKPYEEISKILWESTKDLTEVQRAYTMELIFGSDGQRAATVAIRNGAQEWGNLSEKVMQFDPGEVAKKRMDSLSGSMKQFGGSAETIGVMLIGQLAPGMKTVINTGTELLNMVLDQLGAPETTEVFNKIGAASAQLGDDLYTNGQAISDYGAKFKDQGVAGKLFSDATAIAGSAATGLSAILRGDAKGAAEAFSQAFRDMGAAISPVVTFIQGVVTKLGELNAKAADRGAFNGYIELLKTLGSTMNIILDQGARIIEALGRVDTVFASSNTNITSYEKTLRLLSTAFTVATTFTSIFMNSTMGMIALLIDAGAGVLAFGKTLYLLATGDFQGAKAAFKGVEDSLVQMPKTLKATLDSNTSIAVSGWRNISNTFSSEAAVSAKAVETGMAQSVAAVADGTSGMQQFMEANTTSMSNINEEAWVYMHTTTQTGVQQTAEAVAEAAPQFEAAATGLGDAASLGLETSSMGMVDAAGLASTKAIAEVESQTGAANVAGTSLGENLGSGMEGGILSKIGGVISAARKMVAAALGAGQAEAEIESPSKRTFKDGENITKGYINGMDSLSGEMKKTVVDMMDAALDYAPIAAKVAAVEKEIKELRESADTDALFRGKEMITIDSEALRLRREIAFAEKGMIPNRQALARINQEIADTERGLLSNRVLAIELSGEQAKNSIEINKIEKDKLPLQRELLEIERQLLNVDPDGKQAKKLKEEQEEIRKKMSLMDNTISQIRLLTREQELEAASQREAATVATTGARIRKETLEEQIEVQQRAVNLIQDVLQTLEAEKNLFSANEAIIKNATENEVKYRQELIAVFKAEGKPLLDRIEAGLKLIDQLEAEGKISKELADKLREVAKQAQAGTTSTKDFGNAAATATPQIDSATKKAKEMADEAERVAKATKDAAEDVLGLGKALNTLPSWFTPTGSKGSSSPAGDALGILNMVTGTSGGSRSAQSDRFFVTPGPGGSRGNLPPDAGLDPQNREMQDIIKTAQQYQANMANILVLEDQVKQIRAEGNLIAMERAATVAPLEREILYIKRDQVTAERDILPLRQELAGLSREIANIERGTLENRQELILNDARRKEIRLATIGIERELLGLDRNSTRYQDLQRQLSAYQEEDRLLNLNSEEIRVRNELAATGAKLAKELTAEQIEQHEQAQQAVKNAAELINAEIAVFQANGAIIQQQVNEEVAHREYLIALLEKENEPLKKKLDLGAAWIEQLKVTGRLAEEVSAALLNMIKLSLAGTPVDYNIPGITLPGGGSVGQPGGAGSPWQDGQSPTNNYNFYGVLPAEMIEEAERARRKEDLLRAGRSS